MEADGIYGNVKEWTVEVIGISTDVHILSDVNENLVVKCYE